MNLQMIEFQKEQITLEGVNVFQTLSEIPVHFRTIANNVKNYVKKSIDGLNVANISGSKPELLKIPYSAEHWLRHANYAAMTSVDTYVPPGLNTDILSYSQTLAAAEEVVVSRIMSDALKPAMTWIAGILSDPEKLSSIKDYRKDAQIRLEKSDMDAQRAAIAKHFRANNSSDVVKYPQAYRRNADVIESVKVINQIQIALAKINPQEMIDITTSIATGIDTMIDRFDEDDPRYKLHAKSINDIAATLEFLAQLVEFYATFCFSVMSVAQASKDNVAMIEKSLAQR